MPAFITRVSSTKCFPIRVNSNSVVLSEFCRRKTYQTCAIQSKNYWEVIVMVINEDGRMIQVYRRLSRTILELLLCHCYGYKCKQQNATGLQEVIQKYCQAIVMVMKTDSIILYRFIGSDLELLAGYCYSHACQQQGLQAVNQNYQYIIVIVMHANSEVYRQ